MTSYKHFQKSVIKVILWITLSRWYLPLSGERSNYSTLQDCLRNSKQPNSWCWCFWRLQQGHIMIFSNLVFTIQYKTNIFRSATASLIVWLHTLRMQQSCMNATRSVISSHLVQLHTYKITQTPSPFLSTNFVHNPFCECTAGKS